MDHVINPAERHLEIIELLPDYAIGSLSDAELDRVQSHLEGCPACRREQRHVLEMVGILGSHPVPSAKTRERLLTRARGQEPPTAPPVPAPASAALPTRSELPVTAIPATPTPIRRWRKSGVPIALAVAAALLLLAFGLSTLRPGPEGSNRQIIAGIISDAPFYPLTDSELDPPASGVLFARGDESRAVLLAEGLPPLGDDRHYQVWLFTDQGERASAGFFTTDPSGRAEVLIETPQPVAAYAAIAVSAEPAPGSEEPTSPLALGGWFD